MKIKGAIYLAASLLVFLIAAPVAAVNYATVTGHEAFSEDANHPDYWGDDCTKEDSVSGSSYVLSENYSLVVVKAGSGEFANTIFGDNPSAGQTVWADTNGDGVYNPGGQDGDKEISHIIFCQDEVEETPTPSDTPLPSDTPSPTPEVTPTITPTPNETPEATPEATLVPRVNATLPPSDTATEPIIDRGITIPVPVLVIIAVFIGLAILQVLSAIDNKSNR